MLEFRVLGALEVEGPAGTVALGGAKQRVALVLLALRAGEFVSRDALVDALWPDAPPPSATQTVESYVSRVRGVLRDAGVAGRVVEFTSAGYRLGLDGCRFGHLEFAALAAQAGTAAAQDDHAAAAALAHAALKLWRGPPLAGLAGEAALLADAAALEDARARVVEIWAAAEIELGHDAATIAPLTAEAARHATRERLSELLMLALYRGGRQADALDVFRTARRHLVEELGLEPGPALQALHERILRQDPALLAPPAAATEQAPAPPPPPVRAATSVRRRARASALPIPPTVLFARDADLDALTGVIGDASTRFVTLIGPGGVGKTRLAIETARRLDEDFTDGARFVSLVSVAEPRELAAAIVRALSAPARDGEPPTVTLGRFLCDRHLLLVLDNFEHLVLGAPLVGELLAASPGLTVLATSREPTRLAAERQYPVRPLPVPDTSAQSIEGFGAVALFVDRVRARDPGFSLDEANAPYVREICRRLDGLPLAIELAAARVGVLSLSELAARLDRALTVLGVGARDAPERHRTLRATIDWSFGLLTATERDTFTQLAAFAGGATVAAAECVTGATLDTLDSLVAKQLLVRRDERLDMLETVREYALEQLEGHPDHAAVQERLAAWCLDFAREATPHLGRAARRAWLARIDAELPNLLAALSRALEDRRHEMALQLATELVPYWSRTSRSDEGLHWMDVAIERSSATPARARANALLSRARLAGVRGAPRHDDDVRAALALFRSCADDGGAARCLCQWADAEAWHRRFESAIALSDEAMTLAKHVHDDATIASLLMVRAFATTDHDEMSRRADTALKALRTAGVLSHAARLCVVIGYLSIVEGRHRAAITWLTDGLEIARQLGDPEPIFHLHSNEGLARLFLGELDDAELAFAAALTVCRVAACEPYIDEPLAGIAAIAAQRQQYRRAAVLVGAATRHTTAPRSPAEAEVWTRLRAEIAPSTRSSYGPEDWDRAAADGASLTAHEAIDLGLQRGRLTAP